MTPGTVADARVLKSADDIELFECFDYDRRRLPLRRRPGRLQFVDVNRPRKSAT
jgi:hypothetical protein